MEMNCTLRKYQYNSDALGLNGKILVVLYWIQLPQVWTVNLWQLLS